MAWESGAGALACRGATSSTAAVKARNASTVGAIRSTNTCASTVWLSLTALEDRRHCRRRGKSDLPRFSGATHLESSGTKRGGSDARQVPSADAQACPRARGLGNERVAQTGRDLRHERGDDFGLGTWRRCRGTAARLPAVPLRSRVPGTAGNRRERPTQNPSVFAAFADVRGEVQGSEPATFHRGVGLRLAFLCGFRRLCGLSAVPKSEVVPALACGAHTRLRGTHASCGRDPREHPLTRTNDACDANV